MPMEMRTTQLTPQAWDIVDEFHKLSYARAQTWMGWPVLKWPGDLILYQEILWALQPETLIECGTGLGGSTLFFAGMMDLIGKGHIISIDLTTDLRSLHTWMFGDKNPQHPPLPSEERPEHPRITYLTGYTTAKSTLQQVNRLTRGTTIVVLDSDHHEAHVLKECRLYAPFVTPGSYLVVEDVNINGHPLVFETNYPGPYEATMAFLKRNRRFKWAVSLTERFLLSYNAWLIRQD